MRGPDRKPRKRRPVEERFWSKVDKDGAGGCWLWTSSITPDGYGLFHVDGKYVGAHRFSYELNVGPIPQGLHLDHVRARGCHHRHCVNPAHLEPVTPQENVRRGVETTVCPKGHPYEGRNLARWGRLATKSCRTCANDRARNYQRRKRAERAA